MPDTQSFGRFFLPGPTEVLPEILDALRGPMVGHRAKAMEELIASVQPGLQAIFRTERPVYISTSSSTGLMEAAVRNGALRRVLSLVNGAFSERFYRIAEATGLHTEALVVEWGEVNTPEALVDALRVGDFDAVTVVHSETSTGVLNPIRELAQVCHQAGDVVLLVDSVSGAGGTRLETDAWELDVVLTGSQKALALPPGLAFAVANERILLRAERKKDRGVYFDFLEFEKNIRKNQTPNTPAVSLFYALAAQMRRIQAEGVEARWARHAAMAETTYRWVDDMRSRGYPLAVLAPEGFRSPTVTCIVLPEGVSGSEVTRRVKERGFTIATGYGKLKESTIRIGHMGEHTVAETEAVLSVVEEVLRR
ncbi:MAG: alanine--glyoxylate aminotransferase family protein [Gemmatimonadetes bacterium]|nr:alanine--glyoxylate aminotransferase family protein [Gemmatimonadota bacterium]